jgi:hypothetical protein
MSRKPPFPKVIPPSTSYSLHDLERVLFVGKLVVIDVKPRRSLKAGSKLPIEVIGLFEGISKVVPLWHISKHGPHGKTL